MLHLMSQAYVEISSSGLHVGDVAVGLRFFTFIDMQTPSYVPADLTIRVKRPNLETYFQMTAVAIEDAPNGVVRAQVASASDLSVAGMYIAQLKAVKTGQPTQASPLMHFHVNDRMAGL